MFNECLEIGCLVFASLISPSKMILFENKYQTFDTVFHHKMKHCISCLIYYMKIGRFTPILSVRILFKAVFIGSFLNLNLTFAICRKRDA